LRGPVVLAAARDDERVVRFARRTDIRWRRARLAGLVARVVGIARARARRGFGARRVHGGSRARGFRAGVALSRRRGKLPVLQCRRGAARTRAAATAPLHQANRAIQPGGGPSGPRRARVSRGAALLWPRRRRHGACDRLSLPALARLYGGMVAARRCRKRGLV